MTHAQEKDAAHNESVEHSEEPAEAPVDVMDEKYGAASEDDADHVAEVRRLVGQVINHPVSESM